ncbi:MAG TPA: FlgO family outer membrane protein [Acetobacteraceae bacterium]|nr:FlgO family outer membrane protein [Acetobacteraceae bacterium]
MQHAVRALLAAMAVGLLAGCTSDLVLDQEIQAEEAHQAPSHLAQRTYAAVDQMLAGDPTLVAAASPAVVGSISDIRDVNHSTPFGNIIADLIRSRLVQRGLPVMDMRLRRAVELDRTQGEMTLSRAVRDVYPPPAAAEVVTGTYAVASGTVFVSLKIIEAVNARILAADDFQLVRTADVDRLLRGTGTAAR